MELRREAERSKEEKNEVVLVGRFDSNQFSFKLLDRTDAYIKVKLRLFEFLVASDGATKRYFWS